MKRIILQTIVLLFSIVQLFAGGGKELIIKGIYQGENLYVMNPFSPTGVGFCVYQVIVNGQIATDEINSSAFEIDLSVYNFKIGQPITIILKHHAGCQPKILNPEVIEPRSTFNIESIKIDPQKSRLLWVTSGEMGSLPFIVEQYKWNKWVPVAQVQGKGTPGLHSYSVKIHLTSGLNRFRVKQVDYTKRPRFSQTVTYLNNVPPVKMRPARRFGKQIVFSRPTDYEIYDYYGKLIKKGYGKVVNTASLPKGMYFINYDNTTELVEKR